MLRILTTYGNLLLAAMGQTLQLALERCEAPEAEGGRIRSCIAHALQQPESWLTVRRLNHTQLARIIQAVTVTCDGRIRVAFCL